MIRNECERSWTFTNNERSGAFTNLHEPSNECERSWTFTNNERSGTFTNLHEPSNERGSRVQTLKKWKPTLKKRSWTLNENFRFFTEIFYRKTSFIDMENKECSCTYMFDHGVCAHLIRIALIGEKALSGMMAHIRLVTKQREKDKRLAEKFFLFFWSQRSKK